MKKAKILITVSAVVLALSLIALAVAAIGNDTGDKNPENSTESSEKRLEAPTEPENSVEAEPVDKADDVQREFTEEMKASFYNMLYRGSKVYDPDDENCVSMMAFYESSYYAKHIINGYTLCHCVGEVVECNIPTYEKDGYIFSTDWGGSPSPLMLYLYKDGEFTPIEEALRADLISAKELHDILASDPNYKVKATPRDTNDGVQREFTEAMKAALYSMLGPEVYDPNDENCVRMMSGYESSYYANHTINGYTLCHCDGYLSLDAEYTYEKDGYIFSTDWHGCPSALMLYLYKDGEFITIEQALDKDLVSAKELHDILASDPNYGVYLKPLH